MRGPSTLIKFPFLKREKGEGEGGRGREGGRENERVRELERERQKERELAACTE